MTAHETTTSTTAPPRTARWERVAIAVVTATFGLWLVAWALIVPVFEAPDETAHVDAAVHVALGSMMSDVPHTRPISVFAGSDNESVRQSLDLERSLYEGPVGILSAIGYAAEGVGIPTASLWASVPHYVATAAPSPKATLALLDRLEELTGVGPAREHMRTEAAAWEASIDAAAAEDEDMAEYIRQLERTRDAWDSPEASGDAIAQAFERYLRRRGDGFDKR